MVKNNNESGGCQHQQHGTTSNGTNSNELQFSRHRLELELKFAMAKNDKAELQASNAKLEAKNDMLQRQFGKYQGIQVRKVKISKVHAKTCKLAALELMIASARL